MKPLEKQEKPDIIYSVLIYIQLWGDNMNENFVESWIGIEEAAKHLGVTKDTIRNWIKKTDIPAHKIGKLWKFKRSELDAWVKSGKSAIE